MTTDSRVAASDSGIALQSGAHLTIDNESPEAWELGGKIIDIAGKAFIGSLDFARESREGDVATFNKSLAAVEAARVEDSTKLTSLALKLAAVAAVGVVAFRSIGK